MRSQKIKSYLSSLVEVKLTLFRDKIFKKIIISKLYINLSRSVSTNSESTKISDHFYIITCIFKLAGDLFMSFVYQVFEGIPANLLFNMKHKNQPPIIFHSEDEVTATKYDSCDWLIVISLYPIRVHITL